MDGSRETRCIVMIVMRRVVSWSNDCRCFGEVGVKLCKIGASRSEKDMTGRVENDFDERYLARIGEIESLRNLHSLALPS